MDTNKIFLGHASSVTLGYDPRLLTKHVLALGSSGSGKTCLVKVLIEEAVKFGIPAIVIDSQGDMASLGLVNDLTNDPALAPDYFNKLDLKIWTPGSEWGIPLSLQPNLDLDGIERREDKIRALHSAGQELAAIIGMNTEAVAAGFAKILEYADSHGLAVETIDDVCNFLKDPPVFLQTELEPIFDKKDRQKALKALMVKRSGPQQLLLDMGAPIDIMTMLGYEDDGAFDQGKTRVSVVSLAALSSMEERQVVISAICRAIYSFMLKNPKPYPMGMFVLDEAAPHLPPVRKPVCKGPIMQLVREGRKFGISVVLATQSPGDIDYIAGSQASTKFLGRMATVQEAAKVAPLLDGSGLDGNLVDLLPGLKPGEFIAVCPDSFKEPMAFRARSLISRHETMTLEQAAQFVSDDDRETFQYL